MVQFILWIKRICTWKRRQIVARGNTVGSSVIEDNYIQKEKHKEQSKWILPLDTVRYSEEDMIFFEKLCACLPSTTN